MAFREHHLQLARAAVALYRFAPARLTSICILMLVQGATAGIGFLFILPLLHVLGLPGGEEGASGIASRMLQVLSGLGLPLRLESLLVVYVVVVGAIATLNYTLAVLTAAVQQRYICHLRNQLYRQLLSSRWNFILQHKMSDFVHGLGNQVQGMGLATKQMLSLASQLVLVGVAVSVAFVLSWQMSLLALGCGGTLLLILLPLNRRIYGSGQLQLTGFKVMFQLLTEHLSGLKMIKSYGSESRYAQQMDRAGQALEAQHVRFARLHALTQWINMIGGVIAFALFTYVALAHLAIALPTLMLLLLIFSRLLPQISRLQNTHQQVLHQLPAFADVERISRACEEAREGSPAPDLLAPSLTRSIVLRQVGFRYPVGDRDVLSNFSAVIPRHHTVCIEGPSGVGKSTLADLIAGLLEPTQGTILCDDVPLTGERRIAWRRSVAYVTQEVFLFHDTVRANLDWVADDISEATLWQALRAAAADEFVARLPLGLDTIVGDRGVRLSGGERQRLALARALLSKPQLLILDEATSALDHDNETKIRQALDQLKGKLTILIIAHRETTLEHADARIRLETAAA